MNDLERNALAALRFNWAPTPDDVWQPLQAHVDGMHTGTERAILDGLADARRSDGASPIGVAVLGPHGSGKTHLLGWTREQARAGGGYFFLVRLLDAASFWRSTVISMVDGLTREVAGHGTQLGWLLRRLADLVEAPEAVRAGVTGTVELSRAALDAFLDLLRKVAPQVAVQCQHTTRALILLGSTNLAAQAVGNAFLSADDEEEPGERTVWGIPSKRRSPQEIVQDLSRLLALTGPTVIAVDQIDLLINQSAKSQSADPVSLESPEDRWRETLLIEQIASGLMSLRESTRRTLTLVACLHTVWESVKKYATVTVPDRFREALRLKGIPTPDLGRELIVKRFAPRFQSLGFVPPYPTWPVLPEAFLEAVQFTPRGLLRTVDSHVRDCLANETVTELARLVMDKPPPAQWRPQPQVAPAEVTAELDARFETLRGAAAPAPALNKTTEDAVVPDLLAAGLAAWIAEQGPAGEAYALEAFPGRKPALHARLRLTLDDDGDDEAHWCFRAISAYHHHLAVLNRIRNAVAAAGLTEGVTRRRLFLLRNKGFNDGPKHQQALAAFEKAGGEVLPLSREDLKDLIALRDLLAEQGLEKLRPWLVARRPTQEIELLQKALAGVAELASEPTDSGRPARPPTPTPTPVPVLAPAGSGSAPIVESAGERPGAVPVGVTVDGGPVTVDLLALRRHTAIFAGSGSGKTVLIRRLVEECARQGVSAIVLDPNNDLARLGDPWPESPSGWGAGDAGRAADYLANTDVVIWTPGRLGGRPLSFQPLPDFAGVIDDPDEFRQAVDAAVAALAPRAKVDGTTAKANLGQAVLREALTHFGTRGGGSDLRAFIRLLADLPAGVSELGNADKLAANLAQALTAAMVNDPLFGGEGAPADPGQLLTPAAGKRARVSVISLVGLTSDAQRQGFVNQLQLALFAWVKRHPANDRPLGGLFVMDEAQTLAPSGVLTACTESTLALTAQARKYGLGLVFATQAPKGLHNRIPGNAATQFFGLLTVPAQFAAARDIARAKGSDVPDIAQLSMGQFYAAVEGGSFVKVRAPMCLSHHPSSALTAEEVLSRAAAGDLHSG
jgi:DNA helicase HerA-like ATPase